LAVVLALGSIFAPANRLSAAQPSQGVQFKAKDKNITVSEGVSGLTITIVEDADGNERETVIRVDDPKELKKNSEAHQYFLRYEDIRKQMREEWGKRLESHNGSGNSGPPRWLREEMATNSPQLARIMAGQPPVFGPFGGQSSGTAGGGGGSYGEGYSYKDKHVYISESKQGILIVIEEKVNRRKKETVIRAANPEELKKKHPEAYCYHLWYERDNKGVKSRVISGSGSASGSGRR
jgi:hypothetical protein